ncbi:MAG: hypothetical protein ABI634_02740 [Acidobacteriota bacterium]
MRPPDTRALFFLHIPKTGGTSLRDLLSPRFAPSEVLAFERKDPAAALTDKLARIDRSAFVHGHIPYALVNHFARRPCVVTILRDPIDRAVSAFRYMRLQAPAMTEAAKAGSVSPARARDYAAAARLSLGDFLRDEPAAAARHLGNLQTWLLSTPHLTERFDYSDDYQVAIAADDLTRAKQHLAACDVVVLTERLDESLPLLADALATRPFGAIGTANRTAAREPVMPRDEATSAALATLTSHDRALYAHARVLFQDRLDGLARRRRAVTAVTSPSWPPSAVSNVCTFDGPIPGDGWYGQERAGDRWFSWTGPTCESTIALTSPAGSAPCQFAMTVEHAMHWEFLAGVDVRLNGVRLDLQWPSDGRRVTAPVSRAVLRASGHPNTITIHVPSVSRPSDDEGSDDSRLLGIAVSRVELVR